MGLFGGGSQTTNFDQHSDGTTTPILSPYWTSAYGNASNNLGLGGINPTQQTGINYFNGLLNSGDYYGRRLQDQANTASEHNNQALSNYWGAADQLSAEYALVNSNGLAPIFNNPIPQASTNLSSGAPVVNARSGAAMAAPYQSLYSNAVVDPSLQAYDYGTDRAFSALDARTAAGGGFANSRSGLAYSDLANQSSLGRAQLASQLYNQGLQTAFGFGQQDANRSLTADTTNAGNTLNNSQYNAGALNANSQFNVNANLTGNDQKLQASNQWSNNISNRVGINNDIFANRTGLNQTNLQNTIASIMTPQGIDQNAAMQLIGAGHITFDQLMQLVSAAQASNGRNTIADVNGSSKGSSGGGFNLASLASLASLL